MRYPGILGRRKWKPKEEMGGNGSASERERERERVLKSVAFVCKMIYERTIEMQEVYILPLKKPSLQHLLRLSKKTNLRFKRK